MEISVRQTSIKPKYIKLLLSKGIVLISHLNTFNSTRLSQKIGLTRDECDKILDSTKPKRPHYKMKASELRTNQFERISTLIPELDDILGGGIRCGQLTEISGEAASGKSNMCAQIGVLVMLSKDNNGSCSNVLLIHTEGEGKLKLAIKRFQTLAESVNDGKESIEEKLHVMNCNTENNGFELEEIINRLPEVLNQKPNVKLVIIDSMTCAFISIDSEIDYKFYGKRSIKLTRIAKKLSKLAWDRRIAVIITNHVTYNPRLGENRPALGKMWSHMCQTKIYLERKNIARGERCVHVTKGALIVPKPIKFRISNDIRPIVD